MRRSGHSARPWLADNAIHRAAAGIDALARVPAEPREFDGLLPRDRYKRMNIHLIGAEAEMCRLGASSKLNADRDFLAWLRDLGRARAQAWLDEHFDRVGRESSADIVRLFV